jgi:hypothetical protein
MAHDKPPHAAARLHRGVNATVGADVPQAPAVAPTNVRPIDAARIRRIFGQADLNEVASAYRPPFGERLVDFARRNQERFAVASLILATLLGCYMAFQVGRGL